MRPHLALELCFCRCKRAPVTYISRYLSEDEQRFSQIEKAIVRACENLHCYVFGTEEPFLFETDHRPLESIMNRQSIESDQWRRQPF